MPLHLIFPTLQLFRNSPLPARLVCLVLPCHRMRLVCVWLQLTTTQMTKISNSSRCAPEVTFAKIPLSSVRPAPEFHKNWHFPSSRGLVITLSSAKEQQRTAEIPNNPIFWLKRHVLPWISPRLLHLPLQRHCNFACPFTFAFLFSISPLPLRSQRGVGRRQRCCCKADTLCS